MLAHHSIVSSWLDYANALLYGTSDRNLGRLHKWHRTHTSQGGLLDPVMHVPLSYDSSFTGWRFANELATRYHWSHTRREPPAPQVTCPISSTTTYRQEHHDLPTNCYWLYLERLLRCWQNHSVTARLQSGTHCHIVVDQPRLWPLSNVL